MLVVLVASFVYVFLSFWALNFFFFHVADFLLELSANFIIIIFFFLVVYNFCDKKKKKENENMPLRGRVGLGTHAGLECTTWPGLFRLFLVFLSLQLSYRPHD